MTEAEWLTCDEPREFWEHFCDAPGSARKYRLHACASLRLVWHRLTDIRHRQAVEAAERFANGQCKLKELHRAHMNAGEVTRHAHDTFGYLSPEHDLASTVEAVARKEVARPWHLLRFGNDLASLVPEEADRTAFLKSEAALLRDIFGNPFRPVAFAPAWRTDTAVSLARGMYEARDFGAMPILADALQDAGCDNADILAHCRDAKQVHVRGCWVVDLVLGRT